jgi:hypothetical protein
MPLHGEIKTPVRLKLNKQNRYLRSLNALRIMEGYLFIRSSLLSILTSESINPIKSIERVKVVSPRGFKVP